MIGIDIVQISAFAKRTESEGLVEKIFTDVEIATFRDSQSLAGVFAAKEAFFKALGKTEDWHAVWIEKQASGKPRLFSSLLDHTHTSEMSISHDGDYAVAVVTLS